MIYTSRYSNPTLQNGFYTTIRVSIGTPKWQLGYKLCGELTEIMPFGLLGKYDHDPGGFKKAYYARLNSIGAQSIATQLRRFESLGKDVVLLCYEDIRKGADNWCHRVVFAEWWKEKTGELIEELPDRTVAIKNAIPQTGQLSLFS